MIFRRYTQWLEEMGQFPEELSHLCHYLNQIRFRPWFNMDDNRCDEGLQLRVEFAESLYSDDNYIDSVVNELDVKMGDCSMLELILVLGRRMEFELCESAYEAGIGKWVKELLDNAGFSIYTNDVIEADEIESGEQILDICKVLTCRIYEPDGEGSFFPLRDCAADQRYTELLIQMNLYIQENYDILEDGYYGKIW